MNMYKSWIIEKLIFKDSTHIVQKIEIYFAEKFVLHLL